MSGALGRDPELPSWRLYGPSLPRVAAVPAAAGAAWWCSWPALAEHWPPRSAVWPWPAPAWPGSSPRPPERESLVPWDVKKKKSNRGGNGVSMTKKWKTRKRRREDEGLFWVFFLRTCLFYYLSHFNPLAFFSITWYYLTLSGMPKCGYSMHLFNTVMTIWFSC